MTMTQWRDGTFMLDFVETFRGNQGRLTGRRAGSAPGAADMTTTQRRDAISSLESAKIARQEWHGFTGHMPV